MEMVPPAIKRGWALKMIGTGPPWLIRKAEYYFVLRQGILYHYETESMDYPYGEFLKGQINLSKCRWLTEHTKYFAEQLYISANENGSLVLEYGSPEETQDWILNVEAHISYANMVVGEDTTGVIKTTSSVENEFTSSESGESSENGTVVWVQRSQADHPYTVALPAGATIQDLKHNIIRETGLSVECEYVSIRADRKGPWLRSSLHLSTLQPTGQTNDRPLWLQFRCPEHYGNKRLYVTEISADMKLPVPILTSSSRHDQTSVGTIVTSNVTFSAKTKSY